MDDPRSTRFRISIEKGLACSLGLARIGHGIPWATSFMRSPIHAGTKGASHPCCYRCRRTPHRCRAHPERRCRPPRPIYGFSGAVVPGPSLTEEGQPLGHRSKGPAPCAPRSRADSSYARGQSHRIRAQTRPRQGRKTSQNGQGMLRPREGDAPKGRSKWFETKPG